MPTKKPFIVITKFNHPKKYTFNFLDEYSKYDFLYYYERQKKRSKYNNYKK